MNDGSALRIGIIGLGKMGILHGGVFNALPAAQVMAFCDTEPLLVKLAQRALPTQHFYSDYRRMIEEEALNAIVVTTPPHTHAAIALGILATRPVHMLVEKPLSTDGGKSESVRLRAESLRVTNMVGYMKRYNPVFGEAHRLLQAGVLGDLAYFRASCYTGDVFREGRGWRFQPGSGGVLTDLGPHLLDILLWLFGEPSRAAAVMKHHYSRHVEDYCHVTLEYEGFVGSADLSWSARNYRMPEMLIEIHGTKGELKVTDDYYTVLLDESPEGSRTVSRAAMGTSVPFLLGDPEYCAQAVDFIACVQAGRSPDTDFRSAARVDALLDGIQKDAVRIRR